MFEENNAGIDDSYSIDEDKTLNDTDPLEGIPDEEEVLSKKEDKSKSEIAQKIKYREKFLKSQDKIKGLEEKLNVKEKKGDSTEIEEKEIAAQKYIRKQAREEYEAIMVETKAKEEAKDEEFQTKLDLAVEDSDFSESQVREICDELEVEPDTAVKILTKTSEIPKKPKMPSPKKGSPEIESKKEETPEKKSIYAIAQDIKKSFKS